MTQRSNEQIIEEIKSIIEEHVKPIVAQHGGNLEFLSFDNNTLTVELGGACSGCAGSTMTLKYGVEDMMKEAVPEVKEVVSIDGFSEVNPFYTDPFMFDMMYEYETIDLKDITDDSNN